LPKVPKRKTIEVFFSVKSLRYKSCKKKKKNTAVYSGENIKFQEICF